ncbi:MAG: 6-pyruvoyl-tetrahydropterin synthase-related protein [Acidimicrobiia bacterium]
MRVPTRLGQRVMLLWAAWPGDAVLLVLIGVGVVALHLAVPGRVPSGGDGGNWLALADEFFGKGVMSADVTYPPFVSSLLGVTTAVVGDKITALVIVAILAELSLVGSAYLCVRTLGRLYALAASVVVAATGSMLEAYAWGGYPQLMAMGFGIVATFMVLGYLNTRHRRHLWVGLVFCVLTLLTHTMVGGLLGIALLIAVPHQLYMTDPRSGERSRSLRTGLMVAVPVLAFSALGFIQGSLAGFQPTINPNGLSRLDAVLFAVRDAPYPWAIVAVAGISVLFFRFWPEHVAATIAVGSSWAISSVGLFIVTGEPRSLMVSQMGLVLLAVVGFAAVNEYLRPSTGTRRSPARFGATGHRLLLVGGFSLVAALVAGGLSLYSTATDWYRVVDTPEIAALDHLNEVSQPGDLVVAATGHHGNPIGWWVEGYAGRSTYTAIDPSFLAFPDEREQAEIATSFFEDGYTLQESIATLVEIGAEYVVVDKRGPDAGWLDGPVADAFMVLDDTSNIVVLKAPIETR